MPTTPLLSLRYGPIAQESELALAYVRDPGSIEGRGACATVRVVRRLMEVAVITAGQ